MYVIFKIAQTQWGLFETSSMIRETLNLNYYIWYTVYEESSWKFMKKVHKSLWKLYAEICGFLVSFLWSWFLKLGSHCAITCDNFEVPIAKRDNIKHVWYSKCASKELSQLVHIARYFISLSRDINQANAKESYRKLSRNLILVP